MLKRILGTIGTRYLIAFLNLALIFMNAKVLGVEGLGTVGLVMASVNIAVIVNGILAGNTIVYFLNRYPIRSIFFPAYLWTLVGSGIACCLMALIGIVPAGYVSDIYFLSVISSLVAANARFLLGKNRITGFNITFLLQGGLLFFVLLYFYFVAHKQEVNSYIQGYYITNGIAFIASIAMLLPYLKREIKGRKDEKSLWAILKEMFAYGLWAGTDNLAEVLTSRLNYFLIQRFSGLGSVGLLDAGTKISESVWNISRSIGLIEYSSIAQTADKEEQRKITIQLFKLTFFAITLVSFCILLIPEWFYTKYLFSAEFAGIRKVIAGLSVGIIALGCNSIFSNYFIGSGKIRYSTASSCVGLLTLLMAGYGLIPLYGVVGAAVSSSLAFTAMLCFSFATFRILTQTKLYEFIPSKADFKRIFQKIKHRLDVS